MVHFGFSYVGLLFLIMLFVPNIIWAKNKPEDYYRYVKNENKFLLFLERCGEVLVSCLALIFSDLNVRFESIWSLWLLVAFLFMVLYELYWIRYFRSAKTMKDMYSSFAGFPVAGASLPCLAFFCLGIYGINIFLTVASLILSVGHIGIHLMHRREVAAPKKKKVIFTVIKVIIAVPVVFLLSVTVVSIAMRNYNWFSCCTDTSKGVCESTYIPIGGQEQYVLIRGKDKTNPVILYLHGGPAGPDTCISNSFMDGLLNDYTVVAWNQRGCGRTYFRNIKTDPDNRTVTFERALEDVDELVDYLCGRFGQEKIILVGHSYGTMLGANYIRMHPEKIRAFVGIGQFVDEGRSDEMSYEEAMANARAQGADTSSLEATYAACQESEDLLTKINIRGAMAPYLPSGIEANTILMSMFSPYTGYDDLMWTLKQADLNEYVNLNKPLFDLVYTVNLYDNGLEYEVPTFFISGACDYVCNHYLAEQFCEDISSPVKEYREIANAGHSPHYSHPEVFTELFREMMNSVQP
ncbi:MAG: alpha/beta hydrolase [Saccharofermentans sp.]|nr:alpha/beta hydrolase [Saccharofermentans sp.]